MSAQTVAAPAAPPDDRDDASWFWSLIDAGFLAEIGFDAQRKVLFTPASHPLLGWSQCQVTGCVVVIFATQTFCSGCKRRFAVAGLPEEQFSAIPRPADQPRRRMVRSCRVPGCQRPWVDAPRALCSAHHWQKSRVHRCSLEEFLARTDLEPLPGLGACAVAACYRDASVARSMLCHAHNCRLLDARRADPGLDTDHWLATQTAIPEGAEVSFRGLPDLVAAQVLFGLQQRCRDGALTQHTRLRALTSWLRAERVPSLDALSADQASGAGVDRLTRGPLTTMIAAVRRVRMTAESEYAKDRWDMAALGMTGYADFGGISQPWLRETAKSAGSGTPRRSAGASEPGTTCCLRSFTWTCCRRACGRGPTGGTTRPAWAGRTSSSSSPAPPARSTWDRSARTSAARSSSPPAASSSAAVSSG